MVLPVMTFTDPRLSQPIKPEGLNLALQSGMQFANQLQQMKQRSAAAQQAAAMAPLRQQYLAGQVAAQPYQQQLIEAQAKMNLAHALQLQAAAKAPFGGKFLPGAAGRTQGLQYMLDRYGADSPQYKNTLRDYNADIKAKLGRADYYEANLILKNVPDTAKMQIFENYDNEQARRKQAGLAAQTFKEWYSIPANQSAKQPIPLTPSAGAASVGITRSATGQPAASQVPGAPPAAPATGVPQVFQPAVTPTPQQQQTVTPIAQQQPTPTPQVSGVQPQMPQATAQAGLTQEPFGQEARQLGVGITTKTEPTFVLQKLAFARNIQKTIARMPERAITAYSENPAKLADDYRKSLHGDITPDYAEYLRFITNAKFLSTQTRQFYQDTIQPDMLKRLDNMTNPISWRTNPKAALIAYHSMTGTLGKEINTYVDEASDPKFIEKMRESKVLRGRTPSGEIPAQKQGVGAKAKGVALAPAGTLRGSDGRMYTREELRKIAQGGR
jgi:hypothetical protein